MVLPGFMMKKKKEIDLLTKTLLSKISNRSKKFKKLAETTNICVVYQNEKKIKKTDCKDKNNLKRNESWGKPSRSATVKQ